MSDTLATTYSSQIISTISTLEDELRNIKQSQDELMNAISKAQETSITEQELLEIKSMMDKVSIYNTKLLSIKATMSMLTGRSKQLLVKADKLKQVKMQYLSQIDTIRKMEQEKDLSIAAISTSTSTPASPIVSVEATKSIPKVKSVIKKKKKTKAREALIGDGNDDSESWAPKRSISLLKK